MKNHLFRTKLPRLLQLLSNTGPVLRKASHFGGWFGLLTAAEMFCALLEVPPAVIGGEKIGQFTEIVSLVPIETGGVSQMTAAE